MVEDEAVHHLDRRRTVPQHQRRRRQRVEQILELDRQHGLCGRQRNEVDFCGDDETERALGADDQLREVERLSGRGSVDQLVEVVSAHAAQDLREAALDLLFARACELAHRPVARGVEAAARGSGVNLRGSERAKVREGSVGQDDLQLEHVIDRLAVEHRPRAARVVRDHAADRGTAGGGNIRSEAQAVGAQWRVQLVEHDARLDPGPSFRDVQLEHVVEILRRIELQSRADRLSRLRRAAASRRDRHSVTARDPDGVDDVVGGAGQDDSQRLNLIDAGVGGIQRARDLIEPDLARDPMHEVTPQRVRGRARHGALRQWRRRRSDRRIRSDARSPHEGCSPLRRP